MSELFTQNKKDKLVQACWFLKGINEVHQSEELEEMCDAIRSAEIILKGELNIHRATNSKLFDTLLKARDCLVTNEDHDKIIDVIDPAIKEYRDKLNF